MSAVLNYFLNPRHKGLGQNKKLVSCAKSMMKSSLRSTNSAWSHYYNVLKKVSSLAGQWPYQRSKTRILAVSLITSTLFSAHIPHVIENFCTNADIVCVHTV